MTFQEWQQYAQQIEARAKAVRESVDSRAWKLAASVGIGRCMCSLHNAAIDDQMTGWCAGNPTRLKVAKRADHMLNDWRASRIAEQIIRNAWNRIER